MSLVPTRKALLAVAFAAMLATAGCAGVLDSEGEANGGGAQLDSVPSDAQMVGYVDLAGAVSDDSLRGIADTYLEVRADNSRYYQGPESLDEMLADIENESGLDPSGVHDVTFFARTDSSTAVSAEEAGMIAATDYSEDELVSAMREEGSELSETTYAETTLYTYGYEDQSGLAVLGDGTFAFGDTAAVKSVVDVRAGNEDAVDGDLRSAYESTRDGYLRFASDVSDQEVPSHYAGGTQFNLSAFDAVQYTTGSLYTSGDEVGLTVELTSDSESSATRTYDVLNGVLSLYRGTADGEIQSTLEAVSLDQNGDTVSLSYSNTADELEASIEAAGNTSAGASPAGASSAAALLGHA